MKAQTKLMRRRKDFTDPPHNWANKTIMSGILDLLENLNEVHEYEKGNRNILYALHDKIDHLTRLQGPGR